MPRVLPAVFSFFLPFFMVFPEAVCFSAELQPPPLGEQFSELWYDGHAELAGYDFKIDRYGEKRSGTAATIFVTEPFSNSRRVKSDNPTKADTFTVMKLNQIIDFPTGIYDYNTMLSTFVAMAPQNGRRTGFPMKVSFSSQEWCGHVWQQFLFDKKSIRLDVHSYFDGEADQQRKISYPADGVAEDGLFHWARQMAAPFLKPGQRMGVQLLMAAKTSRLAHREPTWRKAKLSRSAKATTIKVAAGSFSTEIWQADIVGGETYKFWVEQAFPHKIIKWEVVGSKLSETAELRGAERLKYWSMNGSSFRQALSKMGLKPRSAGGF